jgi:hypothetical protein
MKYSKNELIKLYTKETNHKINQRLLLVIKVQHDNNILTAYMLLINRPVAGYGHYSSWLDRFSQEGII